MKQEPIKITIENYNGQKMTCTMSADAAVETLLTLEVETNKIIGLELNAKADEILVEKEDIIEPFKTNGEIGF